MFDAINDLTKLKPETLSGLAVIMLTTALLRISKNQAKTQTELLKQLSQHPEFTELSKRLDDLAQDVKGLEITTQRLTAMIEDIERKQRE